jgi:small subunit ribosomal protein S11
MATTIKPKVKAGTRKKKRTKKVVKHGIAHIHASYNNTIVSLSDDTGAIISWSSAGVCGFKGAKKSTPYAAGIIVKDAVTKAAEFQLKEVDVIVKGIGAGREAAVRALHSNDLHVVSIKDITPIPHNGCRAPRPRRV